MLNQSKGPAVHSLRAQADKQEYTRQMRCTLENTDHLTIRQAEVTEIMAEDGQIRGVKPFPELFTTQRLSFWLQELI